MTRLRALWLDLQASYWFYPALFSIAAAAMALGTVWLDRSGWANWLGTIDSLIPARPDGASNMLTVIAGSMIGVASTVFSITIAAVAYASGNYGPRLLTNFMEDRGNQFSLATFIGTFVYALTVLRSVRSEDEAALVLEAGDAAPGFVPQFSLLIAYLLTGVSVAVLVYFLNHIPASIRINSVLEGIGSRLLGKIRRRYPDRDTGREASPQPGGAALAAQDTGYVQLIDYDGLGELADEAGGTIALAIRTGDFIHPGKVIAFWQGNAAGDRPPSADRLHEKLALGARRTPNQDLDFLIDELVEIALRALSPGINDPFTAITAFHWLGAALAELGGRDLVLPAGLDEERGNPRIFPLADGFDHFLSRGFGSARASAAANGIAALCFLDALADAAGTVNNESRRALIGREADLLLEQARLCLMGPELDKVEARHASVRQRIAAGPTPTPR